jgi:chromosome segregation ATPase
MSDFEKPIFSGPLGEVQDLEKFIQRLFERQNQVAKSLGTLRGKRDELVEEEASSDQLEKIDQNIAAHAAEMDKLEIEIDRYLKQRDQAGENYHKTRESKNKE